MDHLSRPDDLESCLAIWIWGESGTGKSHLARSHIDKDKLFIKDLSKWWDGYKGQDVVLIDDMDVYSREYTRCLKIWSDRYAFPMEIKGASGFARPKVLIVTSQYSIAKIWENDKESRDAIDRRFIQVQKSNREDDLPADLLECLKRLLHNSDERVVDIELDEDSLDLISL